MAAVRVDKEATARDQAVTCGLDRQLEYCSSGDCLYRAHQTVSTILASMGLSGSTHRNSDAFELTAWTVPQQKSTASSQPRIAAPKDRELELTLRLQVNEFSYDLPTSGQKCRADDDGGLDIERLRSGIATDL